VILFIGSSAVRGFGVILIASIVCSIITNVFFSRFLLSQLVRANALIKPVYFGLKGDEVRAR
ncbi:MAG: protein translocase subunit SecD, partial [Paenibacillaceae bacterium]|nr:protein translocase subunit SecD [Paenibacillaceae bacterium]